MEHEEKVLPMAAGVFLMIFGGFVDLVQLALNFAFLIGAVLDPALSMTAGVVFWITLNHCGIKMFTSKKAAAAWMTLLAEVMPLFGGFAPGWFAYAAYLTFVPRMKRRAEGIMK